MHNSLKLYFNKDFDLSSHPQLLASLQQHHTHANSAFKQYAPELLPALTSHDNQFDIFFNKNNQLNITETSSQQALYGMVPGAEVTAEVGRFIASAPYFSLTQAADIDHDVQEIEVLLVFGIGLGLHLQQLLERVKVKFLLVYEPSSSMLRCSTFQLDWQGFLDKATQAGTAVSLQVARPASEVLDNLKELRTVLPDLDKVYVYRHLCDPVYDELINYLLEASGDLAKLTKQGVHFLGYNQAQDYVPIRVGCTLLTLKPRLISEHTARFTNNMLALETYYPGLATIFARYQPRNWLMAFDNNGELNLFHGQRKCFLFRQRAADIKLLIDSFKTEGSKGLSLLGQAVPWKLRDYLHFKTLKNIRVIEAKFKGKPFKHTEQVTNLVVCGCLALFDTDFIAACKPDNLILFEREPDFFYASLFLINWSEILAQFAAENKKLSLNIGLEDNYSAAFFALVQHAKHPNIESTAFLQLSYSAEYTKELAELKSDIRSSQAVGDYFDHARYGINHSLLNIRTGAKFLKKQHGLAEYAHYPVFIVGNGPSLDDLIPYIREYQQQAIIVSCGTALSALMAYDIVPDFHAEAEQNRSTYPLISKAKNSDKLKDINLISFSSVHPDTAGLFKGVYLAFKEGEAATSLIKSYLPVNERNRYSELKHAYPTVTNLAFSYMTEAGFNNIYLFGVDFGQAEAGKHHSAKSVYFKDDGLERYDVEKNSPYEQTISGNFRPFVRTKAEFDMARRTLEVALSRRPNLQVYNCSDGAMIRGATPLAPANILLEQTAATKVVMQARLFSQFLTITDTELENFSFSRLNYNVFECWQELFAKPAESMLQAQELLERSWHYLQRSVFAGSPLLAVLYYNSLSYFYQTLQKTLQLEYEEESVMLNDFKLICHEIVEFVRSTITSLNEDDLNTCQAGSFV